MKCICSVCKEEYEVMNNSQDEELCADCIFELLGDSDSDFLNEKDLDILYDDY
jgi:predicted amidophosphoribosyltransferase